MFSKVRLIKPLILLFAASILVILAIFFISFRLWQKEPPQSKVFKGIAWFKFDKKSSLEGWEEKIFKGRVIYSIKSGGGQTFLNAYSKNSASSMLYWLKFNPKNSPFVSWKWKVTKFPEKKSGVFQESSWLEKDDYAARFYVIFPKFPFFRVQCLEYVWDKDLPVGTILSNPNFNNLKIIVVESGKTNLDKWVNVERNVYEDFKKIFGKTPGNAGAIAIMTDSENTASTAEAQYNDIEVGYAK